MSRFRDQSGIKTTCPLIDYVLKELNNCECDNVDVYQISNTLEEIRRINDELRTWGNEQYRELQDSENENSKLEIELSNLNDTISQLENEISDLNDTISQCQER